MDRLEELIVEVSSRCGHTRWKRIWDLSEDRYAMFL